MIDRFSSLLDQIWNRSLLSTWNILAINFNNVITWSHSTQCSWTLFCDFSNKCWAIADYSEAEWVISAARYSELKSIEIERLIWTKNYSLLDVLDALQDRQYPDWLRWHVFLHDQELVCAVILQHLLVVCKTILESWLIKNQDTTKNSIRTSIFQIYSYSLLFQCITNSKRKIGRASCRERV